MPQSHRWHTGWVAWIAGLAGACLGFWMFGLRGSALFAAIGLFVALVFRVVGSSAPGLSAALALLLAASAFHSASTLGGGGADAPDGTRYKASPVGLSHVLMPRQPVSETIALAGGLGVGPASRKSGTISAEGQ